MEQCPSWEANQFSASQEIPSYFMGPKASLPRVQVPATFPYPEPAFSNSKVDEHKSSELSK